MYMLKGKVLLRWVRHSTIWFSTRCIYEKDLPSVRERGSAPNGGRPGTLWYLLILRENSACQVQVPICAVAAWWFDSPRQKWLLGAGFLGAPPISLIILVTSAAVSRYSVVAEQTTTNNYDDHVNYDHLHVVPNQSMNTNIENRKYVCMIYFNGWY